MFPCVVCGNHFSFFRSRLSPHQGQGANHFEGAPPGWFLAGALNAIAVMERRGGGGGRVQRIQEFAAHSSSVNCVSLGRRSGRVFATGSDDRRVNVWALGHTKPVLSLTGHQSSVECVAFDLAEEVVIAGASGGTVKLWDLEESRTVRTLTGHRSNCLCVAFHPFGEFFGSGSLDTNVKVWDVRRKGCIHTFKGHARGVTEVQFSPDGRWLLSGGEDGSLKLWDLTAGKLIKSLPSHEASVTGICFHPNEYLLATASTDRTVRFWDLETFELAGQAGPEATAIKAAAFTPTGDALMAVSSDALKMWSWEPEVLLDEVHLGSSGMPGGGGGTGTWTGAKVADMCVSTGDGGTPKLLTASYHGSFVAVHAIDLSRRNVGGGGGGGGGALAVSGSATPVAAAPGYRSQHQHVAAPASRLNLSGSGGGPPHAMRRSYEFSGGEAPLGSARGFAAASAADSPPMAQPAAKGGGVVSPFADMSDLRGAVAKAARGGEPEARARPKMITTSTEMGESFQGMVAQAVAGAGGTTAQSRGAPSRATASDHDGSLSSIENITADHASFMMKMKIRKTNLRAIQTFWSKGDVKGAIAALAKAGHDDVALVHDVLSSLEAAFRASSDKPGQGMTLEHCGALLPFVDMLVTSQSGRPERDLPLALSLAENWLTAFAELVRSVLLRHAAEEARRASDPRPQGAIDFSFEERVDKCRLARDGFRRIRDSVLRLGDSRGAADYISRASRLATAIDAQLGDIY